MIFKPMKLLFILFVVGFTNSTIQLNKYMSEFYNTQAIISKLESILDITECPMMEVPIGFDFKNCTSVNLVVYEKYTCKHYKNPSYIYDYDYVTTIKNKEPLQLYVPFGDYKIEYTMDDLKVTKMNSQFKITFNLKGFDDAMFFNNETCCGGNEFERHSRETRLIVLNRRPPIYTFATNKLEENPLRIVSEQFIVGICSIYTSRNTTFRMIVEKKWMSDDFNINPDYSDISYIQEKNCN